MTVFHLPDLGEGLADAEIREWYVKEGDQVKVDQPLLSVETAKAVVDVPSPFSGKIRKLHGKAQETILTHALLVEFEDEPGAAKKDKGSIVGELEESAEPLQEQMMVRNTEAKTTSLKILPTVRALAKQLKVDLSTVTPTGPQGQITAEDVKRQQKAGGAGLKDAEALHGVRKIMAQVMAHSQAEVAPITIMDDADIGHHPAEVDMTALLLQAIAAAAKAEPALNAYFDGKALERKLSSEVHIGLAMDTPQGLFVPVLKNVETQTPKSLRAQINAYKKSVADRSIAAHDMQGATISLSNFGMMAGKYATPIVVPPMVAILGCGRTHDAVIARDGQAVVTRLMPLSLSADHRAVTGGEAVRFLAAVKTYLEGKH